MNKSEFKQIMEREMERDVSLDDAKEAEIRSKLGPWKTEYENASDEQTKNSLERKILKFAQEEQSDAKGRSDLAETGLDKMEFDGRLPIFRVMADIVENNVEKITEEDGSIKYAYTDNTPEGFEEPFAISQVIEKTQEFQKDERFVSTFEGLINNNINQIRNIKEGDSEEFPFESVYNNILNNVINSDESNIYSIANHKNFGNKSWKDSLVERITQGTYEELGITTNEIESLDPTPDGRITPEDARVIVDKFEFEDKPELREELANYYTKIIEKQWNANIPKKHNKENKEADIAKKIYTNNNNTKTKKRNIYNPNDPSTLTV
tara:strand:+ start:9802 stop:10767 length:966 start_codon:yes stop_codon:yes gene_type:complete